MLAYLMVVNTAVRRSNFRRRPGAQETLVALGDDDPFAPPWAQ